MSKQHHDIGWQKRQAVLAEEETPLEPTPEGLARELVKRGLARWQILDAQPTYSKAKRPVHPITTT